MSDSQRFHSVSGQEWTGYLCVSILKLIIINFSFSKNTTCEFLLQRKRWKLSKFYKKIAWVFVCLLVSNKGRNGWTDRAQILWGTSHDIRKYLWMTKISKKICFCFTMFAKRKSSIKMEDGREAPWKRYSTTKPSSLLFKWRVKRHCCELDILIFYNIGLLEFTWTVLLRSHNDITCTICSFLFQALDDILLENEGNVSNKIITGKLRNRKTT